MGIENIGQYESFQGIGYIQNASGAQRAQGSQNRPTAGPASEMSFSPAARIAEEFDLRNITPRQVTQLADRLLKEGLVSFDRYSYLAFQPKLPGGYAGMIESLTGESVDPDQPFDLIDSLQTALGAQKQAGAGSAATERTESLLKLTQNLEYMRGMGL
ncbi:MAG: hypothetical protein ACLFV7_13870 [Phycisphaerae bacterium]